MADIIGDWTYRSFINNPVEAETPADAWKLIFGQGALTISKANPADGFVATLSFGGDAVMDLVGPLVEAAGDAPMMADVKGRGRAGSPIADFAYDYIFYLAPTWPAGIDQRPALVGTVVRAADHGSAKAGAVASTITVRADG